MDNPKFKRSQSPKQRGESPDDFGRPRAARRTGTFFSSTLTTSLEADDYKNQSIQLL